MAFQITGKVALVSGGASGIGLAFVKELLRNGAKGVTIADINEALGKQVLEEIQKEFGANKAIFVRTDVSSKESYEDAFKKTIEVFKNLDILINNAGIFNDKVWEREIAINVNGVINGIILGLETYIPKYRSGEEGVIVNLSSIAGIHGYATHPVYASTKFAITGASKAFGSEVHYRRTKVKVLAICPGITETPILSELAGKDLGAPYYKLLIETIDVLPTQKVESVALALIKVIKNGKTGSIWVAEGGKEPYEFLLPPRESFAPK